jgi:hypothetical protein
MCCVSIIYMYIYIYIIVYMDMHALCKYHL